MFFLPFTNHHKHSRNPYAREGQAGVHLIFVNSQFHLCKHLNWTAINKWSACSNQNQKRKKERKTFVNWRIAQSGRYANTWCDWSEWKTFFTLVGGLRSITFHYNPVWNHLDWARWFNASNWIPWYVYRFKLLLLASSSTRLTRIGSQIGSFESLSYLMLDACCFLLSCDQPSLENGMSIRPFHSPCRMC